MRKILLPFGIAILIVILYKFLSLLFKKQRAGEDEVSSVLDALPKDSYTVLKNLIYNAGDKVYQYDHIIVSSKGIFAVQTENYRGRITGSEDSEKWEKTLYKGSYQFDNPLIKNKAANKALAKKIGVPIEKFIPICVFRWDSYVRVKTTESHFVYIKKLLRLIVKYQDDILTEAEVEAAISRLKPLVSKRKNTDKGK